jgi:asparagine synthase (glutamine-hydrolysing)
LVFRLGYAIRLRSGYLRRQIPAADWSAVPLRDALVDPVLAESEAYLKYRRGRAPRFFFSPSDRQEFQTYFAKWDTETRNPQTTSERIAQGRFSYFSGPDADIGVPPDWHGNPFTGQRAPADRHWTTIGDLDNGDIKIIWEPNRFGCVFPLVRAYWRVGDELYPELFWRLIEDWHARNPPQQGPNWKCGQEVSLRTMAWCFGLYGFLGSESTTAQRVSLLGQMVAVSGQRIEANLDYALSQQNNHGISEAMGLWTIGCLFPELRSAARWRETGCQVLETLGRELIYDDGSFAQHSVNYHRLMLHDYVWSIRLGDLLKQPFSAELRARVGRAGEWLHQLRDASSGRLPNYGQNDGALILPLSNCDYRDFRPVVQATQYLLTGTRSHDQGPWDEDLLWLFGPDALNSPSSEQPTKDLCATGGGYYTLRTPTSFAFTRCTSYEHRPGQADMLHVDLWWKGQNIAIDAGTYSYNELEPWNNPLAHTAYHNTVTVDGLDQMERASRFLWLPWLLGQASPQQASQAGHLSYWEGGHSGYQIREPPVSHRRGILRLGDDWWLVADSLTGEVDHCYRLHWLLADFPHHWCGGTGQLTLQTPAGTYHMHMASPTDGATASLIRGDPHSPRGWQAPTYHHRKPALSADLVVKSSCASFWTLFGPALCDLTWNGDIMHIKTQDWQSEMRWQTSTASPLITCIAVEGSFEDSLRVTG